MIRTLIVCPGRGSYDRSCLGSLSDRRPAAAEAIAACDRYREALGRPPVTALDAEPRFRSSLHVAGEHASLLTFAASIADAREIDRSRYEIVGVAGNSMGWYTALAVAGALPLDEGIRLVETMGAYQARNVVGGQLLYPIHGPDLRPCAANEAIIADGLAVASARGHVAAWSIRLGGYAVLGADDAGLAALVEVLPPLERSGRTFPLRLPMHSAFHTPLMQPTADRAAVDLADLAILEPGVPLFDGRGQVFRPRSADPAEILDYTLGHQVVAPYDFTRSIHTALRHCAPDVVVCLGPGNPLGGPVTRILVSEGWRGVLARGDLDALAPPALLSFGLRKQREQLVA